MASGFGVQSNFPLGQPVLEYFSSSEQLMYQSSGSGFEAMTSGMPSFGRPIQFDFCPRLVFIDVQCKQKLSNVDIGGQSKRLPSISVEACVRPTV